MIFWLRVMMIERGLLSKQGMLAPSNSRKLAKKLMCSCAPAVWIALSISPFSSPFRHLNAALENELKNQIFVMHKPEKATRTTLPNSDLGNCKAASENASLSLSSATTIASLSLPAPQSDYCTYSDTLSAGTTTNYPHFTPSFAAEE